MSDLEAAFDIGLPRPQPEQLSNKLLDTTFCVAAALLHIDTIFDLTKDLHCAGSEPPRLLDLCQWNPRWVLCDICGWESLEPGCGQSLPPAGATYELHTSQVEGLMYRCFPPLAGVYLGGSMGTFLASASASSWQGGLTLPSCLSHSRNPALRRQSCQD